MIGIGTWSAGLDTSLIRKEGVVEISDNNGKYEFNLLAKDKNIPEYIIEKVDETGDNTLEVTIVIPDLGPEKKLLIHAVFQGDKVTGYLRAPLLGKITLTNGRRVK